MACQQLFIDLRQQMAHYRPTLSHNENQEGALLLSGGVRRELMKEGGREGHHAAWDPVNGALLPVGSPPPQLGQPIRLQGNGGSLGRGKSSIFLLPPVCISPS